MPRCRGGPGLRSPSSSWSAWRPRSWPWCSRSAPTARFETFRRGCSRQSSGLAADAETLAARARARRRARRGGRAALRGRPALGRAARRPPVGARRQPRRPHPAPAGRAPQVTRVAVVDLGTNSTRLLVADVEGDEVRELERRLTVTRLGEGGRRTAPAPPDGRGPSPERARRLPPGRRGARRRADARHRDERRPRRGERRGLPRRDRVELRLRHAAPDGRGRGAGRPSAASRPAVRSRPGRSSWTSAAVRPSSSPAAPTGSNSRRASTSAASG